MSKKKTTSKKKRKKSKLIRTRGMGLSIKLFKHEGLTMTPGKLASALKAIPYAPKKKKELSSGFVKATAKEQTVIAEFVASFRVPVLSYDADGNLTPVHYIGVDKGTALIKLDRGTIEVRGSERVARKFISILDDVTGAKITTLNLNGGTKKLYDKAAEITSVLLAGLEKGGLSKAEFHGKGIAGEDDILMYTRRYKGEISRFRGSFGYPSGAFLTTVINANSGSIMIYRAGDGILEKDVNFIVKLMEDAALG